MSSDECVSCTDCFVESAEGVDLVFEVILRRLLSEVFLVAVDVAEREEAVRAVAAAVIDYQRVKADPRRRAVNSGVEQASFCGKGRPSV